MEKKRAKVKALSKHVNKSLKSINKNIIRNDFNNGLRRLDKNILKIDKEIDKDVVDVERWVIERRKFFIKLGGVVLFVLILFVISELFLTVKIG
jgi:hypothetical protein